MNQTTKNLYAYAEIMAETRPPIVNRFTVKGKALRSRTRRAVRTLQVKAAMKKLFPMEMHLMTKREIR